MPPYYDVNGLYEKAQPYEINPEDYTNVEDNIRTRLLADALNKDPSEIIQLVDSESKIRPAIFIFTYFGYLWLTRNEYHWFDRRVFRPPRYHHDNLDEYTRTMLEDARGFETKQRAITYTNNSNRFATFRGSGLLEAAEEEIEHVEF